MGHAFKLGTAPGAPGTSRLALTSLFALATALAIPAARADAAGFAGTPGGSTIDGGVNYTGTGYTINRGATTDTVTISGATAVIDWAPTDTAMGGGHINFLDTGHTVAFQSDLGAATSTYTVLNRINPADATRIIDLNGTITSKSVNGGSLFQGGNIWFYSPAGILIGGSAVFNVGSLLLTTGDPAHGGSSFTPGTVSVTSSATGSIEIANGAAINAKTINDGDSYVAVIAPVVKQSGTVTVNGSAAYVAGEQVSMTINNGLFDISVPVGSDTPVEHSGSTLWPDATSSVRRIYLVSVAKNTALTALLGGTTKLGFDLATDVTFDGSAVVLSAGHNIVGGLAAGPTASAFESSVNINAGTFNADVLATATGDALATSLTGLPTFNGNVSLTARHNAALAARATGGSMTIAGSLTLDASRGGTVAGEAVVGGFAHLYVENGATLTIGGQTTLRATATGNGYAGNDFQPVPVTGGQAKIDAASGTLQINNNVVIDAKAIGSTVSYSGSGTPIAAPTVGGTVDLIAPGGIVNITGGISVDTSAASTPGDGVDGSAVGGYVTLSGSNSGALTVGGYVNLVSNGAGASAATGATASAAQGGVTAISADSATVHFYDAVNILSRADGGQGTGSDVAGANATGGTATISTTGGTLIFGNGLFSATSASGGAGLLGMGGNGTGGGTTIGGNGSITASHVILTSYGEGGSGQISGGAGVGGTIDVGIETGSLTINSLLDAKANGIGGNAGFNYFATATSRQGTAGSGDGGKVSLATTGGGSIALSSITMEAKGQGGSGHIGGGGFGGANGKGAFISSNGGEIHFTGGGGTINASGTGGTGADDSFGHAGAGGVGQGGDIRLSTGVDFGDALIYDNGSGEFALRSTGTGGDGGSNSSANVDPAAGAGGAGLGGAITVETTPGTMTLNTLTLDLSGQGGFGGNGGTGSTTDGGAGGAGAGGTATVRARGGSPADGRSGGITLGTLNIYSDGSGGIGGAGGTGGLTARGGAGGAGSGGLVDVRAEGQQPEGGSALSVDTLNSTAHGTGGDGGNGGTGGTNSNAGGNGGDGTGGRFWLGSQAFEGLNGLAYVDTLTAGGNGVGGSGGSGGGTSALAKGGSFKLEAINGLLEVGGATMTFQGADTAVSTVSRISAEDDEVHIGGLDVDLGGDLQLVQVNEGYVEVSSAGNISARSITGGCILAGNCAPPTGGFLGTPDATSGRNGGLFDGNGYRIYRTNGRDRIVISAATAVIDWTPADNAMGGGNIDFLPVANSVAFESASGLSGNYTVLNRILPSDTTRKVELNGTITSKILDNGSLFQGGKVWFYTPAGILIGSTAVFNVGSLLLATGDPSDGEGNFDDLNPSMLSDSDTASIEIASGALISAQEHSGNAYVTVVAPVVKQSGSVVVDGSAAYVVAKDVDIAFNDGLFDIHVLEGSDSAVEHLGSTVWATGGSATDRRIALVSTAKTSPLTWTLSGTTKLGFSTVGDIQQDGSAVILSAGNDLSSGALVLPGVTAPLTTLSISGGTFNGNVFGAATGDALVSASTSTPHFEGDLTLAAPHTVQLGVTGSGATMTIGGSLTLNASVQGTTGGAAVEGGLAQLYVDNGSTLNVGGSVLLSAIAVGEGFGGNSFQSVEATGGTAKLDARNGTIGIGGQLNLNASASGAMSPYQGSGDPVAVAATGGNAIVSVATGSHVTVGSSFNAYADAQATAGSGSGGVGTGGQISISTVASGASFAVTGSGTLSADGRGGDAAGNGNASLGQGGNIAVTASNGDTLTFTGSVNASANGTGGRGLDTFQSAASGTGGTIEITGASGATISFGSVSAFASGIGGTSRNESGGAGIGGTVHLGLAGVGTTMSGLTLAADGTGGAATQQGGAGTGGTAKFDIDSASATFQGQVDIHATGTGGNAGVQFSSSAAAGDGTGGLAQFSATGSGVTTLSTIRLTSDGVGGNGFIGGNGYGGSAGNSGIGVKLTADDAEIHFNGVASFLSAKGTGGAGNLDQAGAGGSGGIGQGGDIAISATRTSGNGVVRDGGGSEFYINASGTGGSGATAGSGAGGAGGLGLGGTITLLATSGTISFGTVSLNAEAQGGSGGGGSYAMFVSDNSGGAGAGATGGTVSVLAQSGSGSLEGQASFNSLTATVNGLGGNGGAGGANGSVENGGNGGDGTGGSLIFSGDGARSGGANSLTIATATLNTRGTGGNGGNRGSLGSDYGTGGTGQGGTLSIATSAYSAVNGAAGISSLTANGSGFAGTSSGTPGLARAGSFSLTAQNGALDISTADFTFSGANTGFSPNIIDASSSGTIHLGTINASLAGDLSLTESGGGTITVDTRGTVTANSITGECILDGNCTPPPPMNPPADGFLGTPDGITNDNGFTYGGSGYTVYRNSGSDRITILGRTAIINWTPTDNATGGGNINFLPFGNTVHFESDINSSFSTFTVLNRILPSDITRKIELNGTITSQILSNGSLFQGGKVWFYTPAGILVGSTAVFNVGSLLLSTGDPSQGGNSFDESQPLSFTSATPDALIEIGSGALIDAQSSYDSNNYVTLVAPVVRQSGYVTVGSSAAYVAAEDATINFHNGLFDIDVLTGSDTSLEHDGSTLWTGSNQQRIMLVSTAKTAPLTWTLGGNIKLGVDQAVDVPNSTGLVVLSAGEPIVNGATVDRVGSTPLTTLSIAGGTFNAAIDARASGDALVNTPNGRPEFNGALTLASRHLVELAARGSTTPFVIGGSVTLDASVHGTTAGENVTGGIARIYVDDGASLAIDGPLYMTASGFGDGLISNNYQPVAATGGTVAIEARNGQIHLGSTANLEAEGRIASSSYSGNGPPTAVAATGGTINLSVSAASSLIVDSHLDISADGRAQAGAGTGGVGTGGTISYAVTGSGNNSTLSIGGRTTATAQGYGAATSTSGTASLGQGGTITLLADDAVFTVTGLASFDASASGGTGASGANGASGTGGTITMTVQNDAQLGFSSTLDAYAKGSGGLAAAGHGGDGAGGTVHFDIGVGGFDARAVTVDARGLGGGGALSGGAGTGGEAAFAVDGIVTLNDALGLNASGIGGRAGHAYYAAAPANMGTAGDGTGGLAKYEARTGSQSSLTTISLSADGAGGDGYIGGSGYGGAGTKGVVLSSMGGDIGFSDSYSQLSVHGYGGAGSDDGAGHAGQGGSGHGGDIHVTTGNLNGPASIHDNGGTTLSLDASAGGGAGGSVTNNLGTGAGDGGAATGGNVTLLASTGDIAFSGLTIDASASGGSGGTGAATGSVTNAGFGGIATGGQISITAQSGDADVQRSGRITIDGVTAYVDATGGRGGDGGAAGSSARGGNGGLGTAGSISLSGEGAQSGATASLEIGTANLWLRGTGGDGGAAGTSSGGTNDAGIGGSGQGGSLSITSTAFETINGALSITNLTADGSGIAGNNPSATPNFARGGSFTIDAANGAIDIGTAGLTFAGIDTSSGVGSLIHANTGGTIHIGTLNAALGGDLSLTLTGNGLITVDTRGNVTARSITGECILDNVSCTPPPMTPPADGFLGTPDGSTSDNGFTFNGSGYTVYRNNGSDRITILGRTAIINWTPTDNAMGGGNINFLPSANTVHFESDVNSTFATYTVLNRILPSDFSRKVELNGTITSQILSNGSLFQGGKVWFYTPAGILVGSTAVFNVGSLLLSTGDPSQGQGSFSETNATLNSSPTGIVQVDAGAVINAMSSLDGNSYVVLAAPIVKQGGTISVAGSAAYIGAEQSTIQFNDGLFNINVGVGSDTAVEHTGVTRWPDATSSTNRRIVLVSKAKTAATTMQFDAGSRFGFDAGSTALANDGTVVLSAGNAILGGNSVALRGTNADNRVTIGGGIFNADVEASATGNARVTAAGTNPVFARDLLLASPTLAEVAVTGGTLTVGRDLLVDASRNGTVAGEAITAGTVNVYTDNSAHLNVNGAAYLAATALGAGYAGNSGQPVASTGGTVTLEARSGSIQIGGDLTLMAGAQAAGSYTGQGSPVAVASTGGAINLLAGSGTIYATGTFQAHADAQSQAGSGSGGTAQGGTITINASGSGGNITLASTSNITADGVGANNAGTAASNGQGGVINILAGTGQMHFTGTTGITANGTGGFGTSGANGGSALGGSIIIDPSSGGTIDFATILNATANALGGGSQSASGGNATAGTVTIGQGSGTVALHAATNLFASGTGGNGAAFGGQGFGGSVTLSNAGAAMAVQGALTMRASGTGGNAGLAAGFGTAPLGSGTGGFGRGGSVTLSTTGNGSLTVNDTTLDVKGTGGNGFTGGVGRGGSTGGNGIFITSTGGDIVFNSSSVTAEAGGVGGNGGADANGAAGNGGNGVGGVVAVKAAKQTNAATIADNGATTLMINALGTGGAGGNATTGAGGTGGSATGGQIDMLGQVGTIGLRIVALDASATGGAGGASPGATIGGVAGTGQGGIVNLDAQSGVAANGRLGGLTIYSLTAHADGTGGIGGASGTGNGSIGADGTGGTVSITAEGARASNAASVQLTSATVTMRGTGGAGGNSTSGTHGLGGGGTGGTLSVAASTFETVAGSLAIDAITANGSGLVGGTNPNQGSYAAGGSFSYGANGGAMTIGSSALTFAGANTPGTVNSTISATNGTVHLTSIDAALGGDLTLTNGSGGSVIVDSRGVVTARSITNECILNNVSCNPPQPPMPTGGFLGTPSGSTSDNGATYNGIGYTIYRTNGTDRVTVLNRTAIIDWSPTDSAMGGGAIDFLPVANSVAFESDPASAFSTYTVLNRINPADVTRKVALNGTITSKILSNGSLFQGGKVWFYTPAGILIGSTAVFNVGSLLLATADPAHGNSSFTDTGVSLASSSPTASIEIANGASIEAKSDYDSSNYVAIVAPIVKQGGAVVVQGSAAYVGAENATLTFNSGLFDISVTTGSDSAVEHAGTTVFSANAATNRRINLVSVAKNSAITMALGGNAKLGFINATDAQTSGSAVVLSAGRNIIAGELAGSAGGSGTSSFQIAGGIFNADVLGGATYDALATGATGNPVFNADVSFAGGHSAQIGARSGGMMSIAGNVLLDASKSGTIANEAVLGGLAQLYVENAGTLNIGGGVTLKANALGDGLAANNYQWVASGGGTSTIDARDGTINIQGTIQLQAKAGISNVNAYTGSGTPTAVSATGGTANIIAGTFGVVHGFLNLDVDVGAVASPGGGLDGNGIGGSLNVSTAGSGSLVRIDNVTTIAASGQGGGGSAGTAAGFGQGGQIDIAIPNGGLLLAGGTSIDARGIGGAGIGSVNGGLGTGGVVNIDSTGIGLVELGIGGVTANVSGVGGASAAGSGGDGDGGVASFSSGTGAYHAGKLILDANGTGGAGQGLGGRGRGGTLVLANGGSTLTLDTLLEMRANGTGGGASASANGIGGEGQGGLATVSANGGVTELQSVTLEANGTGGNGFTGGIGRVDAGKGAYLLATGATIHIVGATDSLSARAIGGNGGRNATGSAGNGGDAFGGQVGVSTANTTTAARIYDNSGSSLVLNASAIGGTGGSATGGSGGNGGAATGGVASITAQTGTISFAGATLDVSATGGTGQTGGTSATVANGGAGGSGHGGSALLLAQSGDSNQPHQGLLTLATVIINSDGTGGTGGGGGSGGTSAIGGVGGEGTGGTALIRAEGARSSAANSLDLPSLTLRLRGIGGAGGAAGTSGGSAAAGIGGNGNGGSMGVQVVSFEGVAGRASIALVDAIGSGIGASGGQSRAGFFSYDVNGGALNIATSNLTFAGINAGAGVLSSITAQNGTIHLGTINAALGGDLALTENTAGTILVDSRGAVSARTITGECLLDSSCNVVTPPVVTPPVTNPPVTQPPVVTPTDPTPPVETPVVTPPVETPVVTPPVVTQPVETPVVTPPVVTPPVVTPPVVTPPVVTPPVVTPPVVTPPAPTPAEVAAPVIVRQTTQLVATIQASVAAIAQPPVVSANANIGSGAARPAPAPAPAPANDRPADQQAAASSGNGDGNGQQQAAADQDDAADAAAEAAATPTGVLGSTLIEVGQVRTAPIGNDAPFMSNGNSSLWQGSDGIDIGPADGAQPN